MNGYVYVMINPSMNGIVKIGMTTREPEDRAVELSATTGVPTPFIVAYKRRVSDCAFAEKKIHEQLSEYRVNDGREFFRLTVTDAINVVMLYEDENINNAEIKEKLSLYDCIEKGKENEEKFPRKAIEFYKEAAKLGAVMAYETLGDLYNRLYGEEEKTIYYYQKAIKEGQYTACEKLANLYEYIDEITYVKYLKEAVEMGSKSACSKLGYYYLYNDDNESFKWYKIGALRGEHDCQYHIAEWCLENDETCEGKNYEQWIFAAANNGNPIAAFKVADSYLPNDKQNSDRFWNIFQNNRTEYEQESFKYILKRILLYEQMPSNKELVKEGEYKTLKQLKNEAENFYNNECDKKRSGYKKLRKFIDVILNIENKNELEHVQL